MHQLIIWRKTFYRWLIAALDDKNYTLALQLSQCIEKLNQQEQNQWPK